MFILIYPSTDGFPTDGDPGSRVPVTFDGPGPDDGVVRRYCR